MSTKHLIWLVIVGWLCILGTAQALISDAHVKIDCTVEPSTSAHKVQPCLDDRPDAAAPPPEGSITVVTNLTELTNLVNDPGDSDPGDTIALQCGVWDDTGVAVDVSGTADNYITIRPETPGCVTFTGTPWINVRGEYVHVKGFIYGDNEVGTNTYAVPSQSGDRPRANISLNNDNNRVTENVFYEDEASCTIGSCNGYRFNVEVNDRFNYVGYNAFVNKRSQGAQLIRGEGCLSPDDWDNGSGAAHDGIGSGSSNLIPSGAQLGHVFEYNYVSRQAYESSNGGESIQESAGGGQRATVACGTTDYNTQILYTYFHEADGEGEVISIKGSYNLVQYVTSYGMTGQITNRSGTHNDYKNIFMDAENQANAVGIRVQNNANGVYEEIFITNISADWKGCIHFQNGSSSSTPATGPQTVTNLSCKDSNDSITFGNSETCCGIVSNISVIDSVIDSSSGVDPNQRTVFCSGGGNWSPGTFTNTLVGSGTTTSGCGGFPAGATQANPTWEDQGNGIFLNSNGSRGSTFTTLPVTLPDVGPQEYAWSERPGV